MEGNPEESRVSNRTCVSADVLNEEPMFIKNKLYYEYSILPLPTINSKLLHGSTANVTYTKNNKNK